MGSIRIVRKKARPVIVPVPVPVPNVKDDKTVREDMLRKLRPSPPERQREEILQGRLKKKALEVASEKKQDNASGVVQSGIRIKFRLKDSSRATEAQQEEVAEARRPNDDQLTADDDFARTEREEYGAEAVEAALILVDFSWEAWGLVKRDLHSSRGDHGRDRNRMDGAENSCNKLEEFHDEDCPLPKEQKKRKLGNGYLPQLECMDDNVAKEDRSYERSRNSLTMERVSSHGRIEVDNHPITSEDQIHEEGELPLKKRGLKPLQAEEGSSNGSSKKKTSLALVIRSTSAHARFTFSIIHLLTAIRVAMLTSDNGDHDSLAYEKLPMKKNFKSTKMMNSSRVKQQNHPFLTLNDIVARVRLNPGDPLILETKEPLQELVRGALKIFSSTEAPQGAKEWEPFTDYSKSKKTWSWIGPVPSKPDIENISAEAWGIPHRILQKLVKSFTNWLETAQDTLHIIGNLPAPPPKSNYTTLAIGERLSRLKPRSAGATIYPCSEQVRTHFRQEEAIRYLIPDHPFQYTALDGKKSAVAPIRRSISGKPSSRCREHFMLKADRPPAITVLSLVRDAAARLPDGVGTRADVCILMRDSQYIVEDIPEEQLANVVSGGLDRLHYENDPCVRFDGKNRFWFYLHRERDEDEFEEDGTVSVIKRVRR